MCPGPDGRAAPIENSRWLHSRPAPVRKLLKARSQVCVQWRGGVQAQGQGAVTSVVRWISRPDGLFDVGKATWKQNVVNFSISFWVCAQGS